MLSFPMQSQRVWGLPPGERIQKPDSNCSVFQLELPILTSIDRISNVIVNPKFIFAMLGYAEVRKKKEIAMKTTNPYSFLLFLSFAVGIGFCIGLLGTGQVVNAQDKDRTKVEKHDDDDGDENETPEQQKKLAKEAKISKSTAEKIALKRVPGKVIESEIDKEDGVLVWEFEIKTKDDKVFEVGVNAKTGEIGFVKDESEEDEDDPNENGDTSRNNKNIFQKTGSGIKSVTGKVWRKISI